MTNKTRDDAFILTMADLLTEKQIHTKTISRSMHAICSQFSFDCGFIYEIDQNKCFSLKEHCLYCDSLFPETFALNEIDSRYRHKIAKETFSYFFADGTEEDDEKKLLSFFSASSMLLSSIVDEHMRIYGLLLFVNKDLDNLLTEEGLNTLMVSLSMFSRYLGMRMYQNKLTFAQNSLENVLDNTGIDIYVNDFYNHDILYVNKSMAAPYGGISAFSGKKCFEVLYPGQNGPCEYCPQKNLIDHNGDPTKVYSWDYQRPFDGSWFRVFSAAFRWVDGRLAHVVSSADITDNKRNEELIQYMANFDSLTNLPNRRMLVSECEKRITHASLDEQGYLLFFDIDDFKSINDRFGHDAGDEFLIQLGRFFSDVPLLKNSIYRNGGDEFVAIVGGNVTQAEILSLADFIHQRFKKAWNLEAGNVYSNISIGVSCYPKDGTTADDLLHKADQAMYKIKKSGGGGVCFGEQLT